MDFLSDYSPAIHQSSHLSLNPDYNKFFGYTAVNRVHSGPFSSVWRVQDKDFNQFALKIMQLDNLTKGPQMDSFRRGISSQILMRDSGNTTSIANIEKAFEIPPSVIMEFIEGENLEEISNKSSFIFWDEGLRIIKNLCQTVEAGHKSKFGVLHRDIRPTNIMIPNYYYGDTASDHGLDTFEVRLLNYDMTWHKDASGRVVPPHQSSAGFYAPELLEEPDGTRARNSRVDSYGIGMTIFRIASGKLPPSNGSNSHEWQSYLASIRPKPTCWFRSAHNYLQRIIDDATKFRPNERINVGDIAARISILSEAIISGKDCQNLEILAENLMFSLCDNNYEVDKFGNIFKRDLDGYRSYQIDANPSNNSIKLFFKNSQANAADWSGIDKSWSQKLLSAKEVLESGGWRALNESTYSQRVVTLAAEISHEQLKSDYEKSEEVLIRAVRKVQID